MVTSSEMIEKIAQEINEDASTIRTQEVDWTHYLQEGLIVSIHIGRWRAQHKLDLEDLGIKIESEEEAKFWNEFLSLGEKKLLPSEYINKLQAIESSARLLLERKSYESYWGKFVPVTAYASWKEKFTSLCDQYMTIRDELIANYDQVVTTVVEGYRVGAKSAYTRLSLLGNKPKASQDEFVEHFVESVQNLIPSKQKIKDSFYFEVSLSYVPLVSMMEADRLEVDKVRQQRSLVTKLAEADQKAVVDRQRQMDLMTQDIMSEFRKQKTEQVDQFMRGIVVQLRSAAYDVAAGTLESIKKNDGIKGKSVVGLRNLIKTVEELNFYNDKEISAAITELNKKLGTVDDRSVDDLQGALKDLGLLCRATLLELGERPRSARQVGIPDNIPLEKIQRKRKELGVEAVPIIESLKRAKRSIA